MSLLSQKNWCAPFFRESQPHYGHAPMFHLGAGYVLAAVPRVLASIQLYVCLLYGQYTPYNLAKINALQ